MKGTKRTRSAFRAAVRNQYWRRGDAEVVLEEWSSSGLTLAEFAHRHGLKVERMRRWSESLGQQPVPKFYPVELRCDSFPTPEPTRDDSGVELVLRGGRRVVVQREFDEELLARVVRVVESWSC
jgi:hypothetical protein